MNNVPRNKPITLVSYGYSSHKAVKEHFAAHPLVVDYDTALAVLSSNIRQGEEPDASQDGRFLVLRGSCLVFID